MYHYKYVSLLYTNVKIIFIISFHMIINLHHTRIFFLDVMDIKRINFIHQLAIRKTKGKKPKRLNVCIYNIDRFMLLHENNKISHKVTYQKVIIKLESKNVK